jgi:hypothetical protein
MQLQKILPRYDHGRSASLQPYGLVLSKVELNVPFKDEDFTVQVIGR